MDVFAILFTLDAIGLSIATYLIRKRRASELPVCIIGSDCSIVLGSKYNRFFFIHNDIAGFLFYIVSATITALLFLDIGNVELLVGFYGIILLGASLLSLIFTYLQWRVIKAWCFWCVASAGIVWLMTLILAFYFYYFLK